MITLCVLLWPLPGQEQGLADYETEVLAVLGRHGATLISRVSNPQYTDQLPYEVQVIDLPDEAALESYLQDPDRAALSEWRDRTVARTELMRVAKVA
ncbi:hypothetical protein [Microlunatus speluncae]|uniref:hypothetical protein n=1 Tax=Microlunatus speluncae TaxID=2594267 RepID=UPI0012666965|nr:hypothetical protein [Microlunatus speluncae]